MMSSPYLFRTFPQLEKEFPWVALGQWPTPLERLHQLGHQLGAEIWCKRDDLSAPRYGGNKVRKLEFLLGEALARGSKTIVTVGGIGSNHLIATAIYAQTVGLRTCGVVFPQPLTPEVHHTLKLAQALDIELIPCSSRAWIPFYLRSVLRKRERPYLIGPGGSSPLGTLGYVSAALELQEQIAQGQLPEPQDIFIALGSGGSLAGLALGCGLVGLKSRIIGVRVVERALMNRTWLRFLMHRTDRLLRAHGLGISSSKQSKIKVFHDAFGGRYGRPTPAALEAVALARNMEGLCLETTYTGKVMAALIHYGQGQGKGRRILFWNTYNSRDTAPLIKEDALLPALPQPIVQWLQKKGLEYNSG